MSDSELNPDMLPQRFCSEIQLFDLCDLDSCHHKSGRFCTDLYLLSRFEKTAEQELRAPDRYVFDDIDESEGDDSDGYDDESCTMDNSECEVSDEWEDEE